MERHVIGVGLEGGRIMIGSKRIKFLVRKDGRQRPLGAGVPAISKSLGQFDRRLIGQSLLEKDQSEASARFRQDGINFQGNPVFCDRLVLFPLLFELTGLKNVNRRSVRAEFLDPGYVLLLLRRCLGGKALKKGAGCSAFILGTESPIESRCQQHAYQKQRNYPNTGHRVSSRQM